MLNSSQSGVSQSSEAFQTRTIQSIRGCQMAPAASQQLKACSAHARNAERSAAVAKFSNGVLFLFPFDNFDLDFHKVSVSNRTIYV